MSTKRILPIFALTAAMLFVAGVMLLAVQNAAAAKPSDYGLKEGDTISATGSDDPDVYIVNELGYKRLFLNPAIFGFYGHLGGFANVKSVSAATRDAFPTSGLFRNCETNDEKVYGVETTGEDTGVLHWVNTTGAQAVADDANFFSKVFCINTNEFNWYAKGTNYTSVSQVPNYARVPGTTATPVPGALSVGLAPDNPGAKTITKNAFGVDFLKVRFSGTGTVNQVTLKRLGAGETDDFDNVYVYDGATRLVSGKTLSSSNGEVTFINLAISVSGTKDISFVADMSSTGNTAGNVNYFQLKEVLLSSGTVSGLPINGNNMTSAGASSGTVTVDKSGALGNPNVGAVQAQLAEFKLTTATEAGSIKRVTMIQGGSVKPQDITNLKLKSGTSEWSGTMTTKGYAVFDLGSGKSIDKGGNAVFKVYGDIAGKKTETIILYFENATDILSIGDQYGQGMAITTTNFASTGGSSVQTLTLQGGVLTLNFVGPTAGNIGTTTSDTVFLRYNMTSAANIEIKKTTLVVCADANGDGTYADLATNFTDLEDIKVSNETTSTVLIGPQDGSSFTTVETTASCPNSAKGLYKSFTDTFDIVAGQTLNMKVTADVKGANSGTTDLSTNNTGVKIILDAYGSGGATAVGTSGDVTIMKYSGTTTAVTSADISPSSDIAGPTMTITTSTLTLGLAATPGSRTYVKGTTNVDMVGITFAATQASALKVTDVTLTGYVKDETADTANEGVDTTDTGVSIANAVTNIRLVEAESGTMIADSGKISNNSLSTANTGTVKFAMSNAPWTIPAGSTKTMLVRVDLTNNAVSGTYDYYSFDINTTTEVTALDDSNNTVNPSSTTVDPNGGTAQTKMLTVAGSGSITTANAPDSPLKAAAYWGQNNVPFSKFRFTSTNEGQYIEKMTVTASAGQNTNAAANVKEVIATYKNKAGNTLTSTQSFTSGASANFGWSCTGSCVAGSASDTRPFVPTDSSMDVAIAANLRTKTEGATQNVSFSLDLANSYNASTANGFKAVGDGSGAILSGTSAGVTARTGKNVQYVYRVFPKVDAIALTSPYTLIGTPTVLKFSVTAMGLSDSKLLFDGGTANSTSGSIIFEVVASGELNASGMTTTSSSFVTYLDDGTIVDTNNNLVGSDPDPASPTASLNMDFSNQDVEISGGTTRTFSVVFSNPTTNYSKTSTTGRAADYFQLSIQDETGVINWVGDTVGSDCNSVINVLKTLPVNGPTFQR